MKLELLLRGIFVQPTGWKLGMTLRIPMSRFLYRSLLFSPFLGAEMRSKFFRCLRVNLSRRKAK